MASCRNSTRNSTVSENSMAILIFRRSLYERLEPTAAKSAAYCLWPPTMALEATHLQHVLDGLLGILGIALPGNSMNFSMTKGGDELSLNLIQEDDVLQEEMLPIRKRKNNKLKTI